MSRTTPRILVIDDEPPVRENLVRFLRLEGYEPMEAGDGLSGVELAMRAPPDLVLCDLNMPRLDGCGVLARLRANTATAAVPFVFLTASTDIDDARIGYLLGASEYVTKPFNFAVLGAIIAQRLSGDAGAKE
jgi:DNA-binding response OmpR family regulator